MKAIPNGRSHSSMLAEKLMKLNGIYDEVYLERLNKSRASEIMEQYGEPGKQISNFRSTIEQQTNSVNRINMNNF